MEREEFERVEGVSPAETPRIPETEYQSHFPKKFEFFGMGRVEAAPRPCDVAECAAAEFLVTFQVMGDELGLCAVAFERAPLPATEEQRSMLTELANVVAAKFVTQMADFNCCDIMVSPPT